MNLHNVNELKDSCCGCGCCKFVCPVDAISEVSGDRGETNYVVNANCIGCGKCIQLCPVQNVKLNQKSDYFYRAITKNNDVLKKSSSGGMAYELASSIIRNNGVVYAAAWDKNYQEVRHKRIHLMDCLEDTQGSKYVQSIIKTPVYQSICKDVKFKKVLFIGCPCQVAAVKNCTKNNENLFCVDLVCHGVPSAQLLKEQLSHLTNEKIESITFRKGLSFVLELSYGNKLYRVNGYDNPYYSLFLNFASLRESCYHCKYAQRERVGDVTIGDFIEGKKGYSCVIVNSEKGRKLICSTEKVIEYEKRDASLLNSNDAFNHPTVKNPKTELFFRRYHKYGLSAAYNLTFYKLVMKRTIRRILGDKFYDCLIAKVKNNR